MFTVMQMIRATRKKIIGNSYQCHTYAVGMSDGLGKKGNVYTEYKLISTATDGNRRLTIRLFGLGKNISSKLAYVHCSCPYFTFNSEVALTKKGSSSIINSNGAYPKITNPLMLPRLCKHAISAVMLLKRFDGKPAIVTPKRAPKKRTKGDIDALKEAKRILSNLDRVIKAIIK